MKGFSKIITEIQMNKNTPFIAHRSSKWQSLKVFTLSQMRTLNSYTWIGI